MNELRPEKISDFPEANSPIENTNTMVFVEGGTFLMGRGARLMDTIDDYENPLHKVTLNSFYIGRFLVTQTIWMELMKKNPSYCFGSRRPVEQVSWYDAVDFCNRLSEKEGLQKTYTGSRHKIICNFDKNGYRLPTEAEWEYAALGGRYTHGYKYSGSNIPEEVAWFAKTRSQDVGKLLPNELGIYDMSGNLWEWCWDWYADYLPSHQTNPIGPNSNIIDDVRVIRGCNWVADECFPLTYRCSAFPVIDAGDIGFRLVRTK